MKLGIIFSSVVYFVAILMQNQGCKGCLEKERIGLLEIKDYILSQKGDPYNELDSWVDDRASNCCTWNKIKCSNISSGHITDLSLKMLLDFWSSNTMLNVSLFHPFEELRLLDLSYNLFRGWIGNEGFPGLNKLDTLDLSDNNLNSSILRSLNELTSLTTLKLGYNFMHNFSAQGFLRSKELEVLELPGNMLNGSIIPSLHEFTSLKNLRLGDNNFNCSLSSLDFTKFSRLELLDLSSNQLTGSLHLEDVQNLRNLKVLSLSNNYMNGSIEGLCKLKDLEDLNIGNNMFSAQLPECLSNLTNLQVLELSNNLFTGNFPSFTSNLTSLTYLSFCENYMQGTFSLSTLANHSKLQVLYISSKSIAANIENENTKWFPKFQLKSLILRNCNINMDKGSVIPNFLSYQYNLILIDLSSNVTPRFSKRGYTFFFFKVIKLKQRNR
ncbi:receptor-like protein 14 [Cicer arietinum]|uniref:receptor-like protein 14 n=1 Tax=Cicer arietinum TaxID=3827 RepID=UPI003CC6A265